MHSSVQPSQHCMPGNYKPRGYSGKNKTPQHHPCPCVASAVAGESHKVMENPNRGTQVRHRGREKS